MLGKLVCQEKDGEKLNKNLLRMISPLAICIAQYNDTVMVSSGLIDAVREKSGALSSIFEGLEAMCEFEFINPIIPIYKELDPVIIASLKKFGGENKIVEELCQVVKNIMRSLRAYFLPYLANFARQVVLGYQTYFLSTYLYCAEFSVTVFGGNKDALGILSEMFNLMGRHTFEMLSKGGYTNNPDIVGDFFGMCMRYVKYAPRLIFESTILPNLLEFSMLLIGFEHVQAGKALYMFIEHFFMHFAYASNRNDLSEKEIVAYDFALANGPLITKKLFQSLCAAPCRDLCDFIIDTLLSMKVTLFDNSKIWMQDAVQLVVYGFEYRWKRVL